jgi:glutathione synthase/RimK-type ligase-like ATP-grasp enzyme
VPAATRSSPTSAPKRRPQLAIAVAEEYEEYSLDWPLLRAALDAVGITPSLQRWTEAEVSWDAFDLILANGAWDNIHRPDDFLAWADRVGPVTRIVNSPAVLRWNIDKRYLAQLADAGIPTVPTIWIGGGGGAGSEGGSDGGSDLQLPDGEFVVKPSVSGGGFETARYGPDEIAVARSHIERLLATGRTAMVQPYQAAVDTQGETSLIFFGGEFSHAIAKSPLLHPGVGAQLNLAINEQIAAATPTDAQRATGRAALGAAERLLGPTTYARIDLVPRSDGTPAVLELELLDPAPFLDIEPPAAARFARVLRQLIP